MNEEAHSHSPGSKRPLEQLDILTGNWTMVGVHPAFASKAHGRSVFEWLLDGGLMLWRFDWERPGPPSAISAIGRDDASDVCSVVYGDERGVTRVYQMRLEAGLWRMWRDAPGFSQRMNGRLSDDSNTIVVHGKLSRDGTTWEQDLDVTYTRER